MRDEGIKQINYLEMHSYVPLKISSDINFDKLCEIILSSEIIQNDVFEKHIHDIFSTNVNQTIRSINSQLINDDLHVKLNELDIDSYEENNNSEIAKLLLSKIGIDQNLKLYLRNDLLEEIEFRRNLINEEFNYSKKTYGRLYIQSHERYFLLPCKIILENEEEFWVIPQLIVFSNLFAFIKYEIPMVNIDAEILKENNAENCIKKIKMIDAKNIREFNQFDEVTRYYVNHLIKQDKLNEIIVDNEFKNILLIDYDNIPSSLEDLNDEIKEEIFYILSAPVPNRNLISYKNDAKKFFETQSCGKENLKFILKTNGGCLTTISKKQLDSYIHEHRTDEYNEVDYFIYKKLAINLNKNCEFAILMNMLEKMNNTIYFLDRLDAKKKHNMTYTEYNKNILFINMMLESCYYATAIEQVKEFNSRMPVYHNSDNYKIKSDALDRIINQEKNEKELRFQKEISLLGLIFVVGFGLPTINETLKLIKGVYFPSIDLISYMDLNQISIILWSILVIFIFIRLKNDSKI